MTLIKSRSPWDRNKDFDDAFEHTARDNIRDLLLGHKIRKIADDHLELDDGTIMRIVPNEGGCACPAGDYHLTDLNEVDNIITNVEFVERPGGYSMNDYNGFYEIFVVAEDKKIKLARMEGSDGNGYYGTGYRILVRYPNV